MLEQLATAIDLAGFEIYSRNDVAPVPFKIRSHLPVGSNRMLTRTNAAWLMRHSAVFTTNDPIPTFYLAAPQEPVIGRTNIPLYRVTALLDGGMTIEQVLEDFPSLTRQEVLAAKRFAERNPNHGKQYPQKSLKRLLRRSGFHRLKKELAEIAKR
jgi:uncharacterized protein (DUF433 family)